MYLTKITGIEQGQITIFLMTVTNSWNFLNNYFGVKGYVTTTAIFVGPCRCARRGLLDCVHCTQLEVLSLGRCGGILGAYSNSHSFCSSCHHSHSCRSSRSCCMEALLVGVVCMQCSPFYRDEKL